jgi:hypothetical protein
METNFTPELVDRLKALYKKKTGQELDDGRAELFLEAYAEYGTLLLQIALHRERESAEKLGQVEKATLTPTGRRMPVGV